MRRSSIDQSDLDVIQETESLLLGAVNREDILTSPGSCRVLRKEDRPSTAEVPPTHATRRHQDRP